MNSFKKGFSWADATSKLEGQAVSLIMPEVFPEVADVVEVGDYLSIKVEVIVEILKAEDHQKLPHTISSIREHM